MRYFSLFTGVGGLDYGLEKIGAECVGFSEIKKSSIAIYKRHYPDHVWYGDITKFPPDGLPDFDILTGGFPCQAFSLAGARKGFEDRKGQMIFYIADILKEKQPKHFVLENVKGIINHRGGKTFEDVMKLLNSCGYEVRVILLNAAHYGTCQNRERVLFLGSREDYPKKDVERKDDTKRFRDIRDTEGPFKFPNITERMENKIEGKLQFKYELIGGYDRIGTLTTQFGCGEKLVWERGMWRYLTPLECERIQGFPDGWTEGESDANRYFALGNAVSCKMSEYVFCEYLKGLWW